MLRTLDTNICSYILRRRPTDTLERFAALSRSNVWLSAIVAAELRFGAAKLGSARLLATIEQWLSGFEVRAWPPEASHHYAHIRSTLEKAGTPIGGMDLLIASHALAEETVLVTCNVSEFQRVPGLAMEVWPSG